MLLDELKTPFRWYSNANLSSRFRKECQRYRYKLITPKDRLLPFMFRFPTPEVLSYPLHWRIYNSDTNALVQLIDDNITAEYIDYYRFNAWDYLIYKGSTAIPDVNLLSGFYYSVIEMADGTLFTSEEFWVDCDLDGNSLSGDFSDDFNEDFASQFSDPGVLLGLKKYTKLTWWHPCDIGIMLYQSGYVNMLYIESEMLKGESEILEEGKEDGNKDFVATFVKLTDNISFTDYVPEHIVNALQGIPIHANVFVTTRDTQYVGKAKRFSLTFDVPYLCHTKVEGKFQQETTLLRSQCCGNNEVTNVYQCPTIISGLVVRFVSNGDGTSQVLIEWNVYIGSGPFRVISPQVSGGAFTDTMLTQHDLGDWPVGNAMSVEVKPVCTNSNNGRVMYGNTLSLQFIVE